MLQWIRYASADLYKIIEAKIAGKIPDFLVQNYQWIGFSTYDKKESNVPLIFLAYAVFLVLSILMYRRLNAYLTTDAKYKRLDSEGNR